MLVVYIQIGQKASSEISGMWHKMILVIVILFETLWPYIYDHKVYELIKVILI